MFLKRTVYPGSQTLEEFIDWLPEEDLAYWRAESALEPWGEIRTDLAGAKAESAIYNVNRKPGAAFIEAPQMMPRWGEVAAAKPARRRKTRAEIEAYLLGYTKMMGGYVNGVDTGKQRREKARIKAAQKKAAQPPKTKQFPQKKGKGKQR